MIQSANSLSLIYLTESFIGCFFKMVFSSRCCSLATFLIVAIVQVVRAGRSDYQPITFTKLAKCKEFDIHSGGCEHFFQLTNLKNYRTDKYKLYLKFYVMTTNDANFVLNNGETGSKKIEYVAVIGGSGNTYSWLRTNDTTIGVDSHKAGILSPLWPKLIIIKHDYCGVLEVSIPNVAEPLIKADAKDLDTKSVCLYAWRTASRWFYNCEEDEDGLLDRDEWCTEDNPHPAEQTEGKGVCQ